MTVGTVPYALQNASHSASVFRIAQSAPFATGGILASNELPVSQQGSPNMSVILGPGRCQIVGTSVSPPSGQTWTTQAQYNAYNDANLTLTVSASNPTNPRIDAVYMQVQDAFYSGATNTAIAGIVAGTPAPSPSAPAIPTNAILIGYIAVAANATSIVNANISYQATLANLIQSPSQGLTRVIPSSVVGATVAANGCVTVSGATAININGCFTTLYDNYVIEFSLTTSAASTISPVLRSAGTDNIVGYDTQRTLSQSTTVAAIATLNAAQWVFSGGSAFIGGQQTGEMKLYGPALGVNTTGSVQTTITNPPALSGMFLGALLHRTASSFDGISFSVSSGTFSGTIRIYGYNNN